MAHQASAIRPPVHAGRFYPKDPAELAATIQDLLDKNPNDKELCADPVAMLAPHAGYAYSGPTAAKAYSCLKGRPIQRVILIGPSHYADFPGAGFYRGSAMETPLGRVQLDNTFLEALEAQSLRMTPLPADRELQEHSLEVQLPFLQTVLEEFTLVPLLMRHQDQEAARGLAEALDAALEASQPRPSLVLASSDLYHGYDATEAETQDRRLQQLVLDMQPQRLLEERARGRCMACGIGAIATAMYVARQRGQRQAEVLARTNSSRVAPSASGGYTVGYMSAAFY